MRETSIDGIPVFSADVPAPVSAGLVFGVGRRDESFVRAGLTHLVEHLAVHAAGRTTLEANASVGLATTEFTATGPPDRVVAFLQAVCRALADPPTDRLAIEVDVLRAEGGQVVAPPVAGLLRELYGQAGAGLAAAGEPALRSLTAADVRDWAARWFCRQNAALWLSAPLPAGVRLPLPDGVVPRRPSLVRRELRTPAWTETPLDGRVTLGAEVSRDLPSAVALGVLRERVEEELRHRRGLAYAVEADRVAVDPDVRLAVLTTDVRPGREALAARLLWREVGRLAAAGPLPAELDHERALVRDHLADPRSQLGEARAHAQAVVSGIPARSAERLRRDAAALTPEAVREAAATLRDAAVLVLPEGVEPPDLQRLRVGSADRLDGRVFRPARRSGAPRGATLVIGEEGVCLTLGETEQVTVRWPDVVGLVWSGAEGCELVGRDGATVAVLAVDWRDGAEAVESLRGAVPAELQVVDDRTHDQDGLLLLRVLVHRVAEAVGFSRDGLSLVGDGEWTAVVPDGVRTAVDRAVDLAGAGGPRTVALVLRRDHGDLEYVLFRRGHEIDRHRWGVVPGDPALLAETTGRPVHAVAAVLADAGAPAEVLDRLVALLDLPGEVPDLLAGRDVAGERVDGRGLLGGVRAAVRGAYAPPPGTGSWLDRWVHLSRTRPRWYRGLSAAEAVLVGFGAWRLVVRGRTGLGAGAVVWALGSLWEVCPPRRRGTSSERPAG